MDWSNRIGRRCVLTSKSLGTVGWFADIKVQESGDKLVIDITFRESSKYGTWKVSNTFCS
jgi:hypothetical protein